MQYAERKPGISTPVSSVMTIADFQKGFKRIAKKTSSSPSGRHIGHYKAILKDDLICIVYSTLISVPFEFGFTLDRWLVKCVTGVVGENSGESTQLINSGLWN
jgi:hypothetical protein